MTFSDIDTIFTKPGVFEQYLEEIYQGQEHNDQIANRYTKCRRLLTEFRTALILLNRKTDIVEYNDDITGNIITVEKQVWRIQDQLDIVCNLFRGKYILLVYFAVLNVILCIKCIFGCKNYMEQRRLLIIFGYGCLQH